MLCPTTILARKELSSGDEIALEHCADDALIAGSNLGGDIAADRRLPGVVFVAVGVAAIDHHLRADVGLLHLLTGCLD